MAYSIGLDLGTGATKAVLWDGNKIVKSSSLEIDFLRDGEKVSIESFSWLEKSLQQIKDLAAYAKAPIEAVAMCAASGNTLVSDEKGKPLCNIISWLDGRKIEVSPVENLHEIIGWPWVKGFPYTHIKELQKEFPEIFTSSCHVGMNNDLLQYHLCGKWALDHSSATPFYLQDQRCFSYYKPFLADLALKEENLSPLVPSCTVIGNLKKEMIGGFLTENTKVVAGSFDHPSAARACDIVNEGEMLISCGTSWVGFAPVKERTILPGYLSDPFMIHEGGCWGLIRSWSKVGLELEEWIVTHYGKEKDRYQKFNDDALCGEKNAKEKMLETCRTFRERAFPDIKFSRIVLCGGPSESPAWKKYLAEVWEAEIETSPFDKYTGAAGAAKMALKGVKNHA